MSKRRRAIWTLPAGPPSVRAAGARNGRDSQHEHAGRHHADDQQRPPSGCGRQGSPTGPRHASARRDAFPCRSRERPRWLHGALAQSYACEQTERRRCGGRNDHRQRDEVRDAVHRRSAARVDEERGTGERQREQRQLEAGPVAPPEQPQRSREAQVAPDGPARKRHPPAVAERQARRCALARAAGPLGAQGSRRTTWGRARCRGSPWRG